MSSSPDAARTVSPPARAASHVRERLSVVAHSWLVIVQATVAASLAYLAAQALGHEVPFFAPIAAIATVAISLAQRMRRASELVLGNAIGILFADVLIARIGAGAWQIGLVVCIALISAIVAGGGPILIMQASSAAILIATLTPPTVDQPFNTERFIDALVGGAVGLLVSALLMPPDPTRTASRATAPVLATLAQGYRNLAAAVTARDAQLAGTTLAELRATSPVIASFHSGLAETRESVRLAPWYWGQRTVLASYALAGFHLDNALRNLRVLARHAAIALDRDDPTPHGLDEALGDLARATEQLAPILAGDEAADGLRDELLAVLAWAVRVPDTRGERAPFSAPMRIQVRLTVSDLLQASGLTQEEVVAAVAAVS